MSFAIGDTTNVDPKELAQLMSADDGGERVRDLTQDELTSLYDDFKCPFCGSFEFIEGPSGGMSTNWYCANELCSAGFNLIAADFGWSKGELIREPKPKALA